MRGHSLKQGWAKGMERIRSEEQRKLRIKRKKEPSIRSITTILRIMNITEPAIDLNLGGYTGDRSDNVQTIKTTLFTT